ncbi:hypothetical protein E2C01_015498 [Portunus trituberculatus]|uniref:Uncharacterized protein n=1 Tax=Portunus trituberculatus TaxID=210409 RepID=A0A5B7DLP9_PORTR|nr:hypothetical protein [Portunus trituberculatus]
MEAALAYKGPLNIEEPGTPVTPNGPAELSDTRARETRPCSVPQTRGNGKSYKRRVSGHLRN